MVENASACLSAKWLSNLMEGLKQHTSGLFIEGAVTARAEVPLDGGRIPRLEPASEQTPVKLLFATAKTCTELENAIVDVHRIQSCCDVFPPGDFPCFFGIAAAEEIPAEIRERMAKE